MGEGGPGDRRHEQSFRSSSPEKHPAALSQSGYGCNQLFDPPKRLLEKRRKVHRFATKSPNERTKTHRRLLEWRSPTLTYNDILSAPGASLLESGCKLLQSKIADCVGYLREELRFHVLRFPLRRIQLLRFFCPTGRKDCLKCVRTCYHSNCIQVQ